MPGIFLAFGLLFLSGILFSTTRSAASGRIPPNSGVGIRTKWTRSSQEAWVAGHRAALPTVLASSLICAATGIATLALSFGGASTTSVLTAAGIGYTSVVLLCLLALKRANDAAKRVLNENRRRE